MRYAHVLNVATEWPEIPVEPPLTALRGRAVVLMCHRPAESGGIVLPDSLKGNLRPDAGVVVSSGVDGLGAGDRVYIRPGVGLYWDDATGWYRVLGMEVFEGEAKASAVGIWQHVVAIEVDGVIEPTPGNAIAVQEEPDSPVIQFNPPLEFVQIDSLPPESELAGAKRAAVLRGGNALKFGNRLIIPEEDLIEAA